MSDRVWDGSVDEQGRCVSACGLCCPFCGASVTVNNDMTISHHEEYTCRSWDKRSDVREFCINLARTVMAGSPGWC